MFFHQSNKVKYSFDLDFKGISIDLSFLLHKLEFEEIGIDISYSFHCFHINSVPFSVLNEEYLLLFFLLSYVQGPQYVCTNFWTFVCTTCSGIQ